TKAESPETKSAEEAKKAVEGITEDAKDLPSATDAPTDTSVPKGAVEIGPDGKAVTPEQAAAAPAAAAPAAAAPAAAAPAAAPVAAADPVAAAPAAGTPVAPPAA